MNGDNYRPGFLFPDVRLGLLNQQILLCTYKIDSHRLPMKGVHEHYTLDARPKQKDIHILLRKFSLN